MIKGLSDRRRLPRLGKIRLGIRAENDRGTEYPKAVDYFVCPDSVRQVYGDKPRALDIMFPVEDEKVFFPQAYKRYGSGTGLICKGDGEAATQIDPKTGEFQEVECDPEECPWFAKKHCRPIGNLQFLLPRVPGLGVWQLDTSSVHSIININSAIDFIRAACGRIRMIPLRLVVEPKEVQPDGKKKIVWVLNLTADFDLANLQKLSRINPTEMLLPPVDDNEVPDDLYPRSLIWPEQPQQDRIQQTDPGDGEPEILAQIEALFDELGAPEGKRKATWQKYGNAEAVLEVLNREVDKKLEQEANSETKQSQLL